MHIKILHETCERILVRLADRHRERLVVLVLTKISEEVAFFLSFDAVALAVFKHLLLLLKAYLLSKLESVLVLLTLLRRAGMQPHIEIYRLLLPKVLDTIFGFSFHCPRLVEDRIAVIVIYGGFAPTEIILQPEARTSVGHLSLDELRILFQFIW